MEPTLELFQSITSHSKFQNVQNLMNLQDYQYFPNPLLGKVVNLGNRNIAILLHILNIMNICAGSVNRNILREAWPVPAVRTGFCSENIMNIMD